MTMFSNQDRQLLCTIDRSTGGIFAKEKDIPDALIKNVCLKYLNFAPLDYTYDVYLR